jgi:hypothetical protein
MSTYGVAGTSPFGKLAKPAHLLLRDAVEANWNTFSASDPPASDIYFLGAVAWRDYGDIQMSFHPSINVRPTLGKSVGGGRIPELAYVSIHLWVRGNSMDAEPVYLAKIRAALEQMIDTMPTTLIPPLIVTLDRVDPAPPENAEDTTWHWVYNVLVRYDLVKLT